MAGGLSSVVSSGGGLELASVVRAAGDPVASVLWLASSTSTISSLFMSYMAVTVISAGEALAERRAAMTS